MENVALNKMVEPKEIVFYEDNQGNEPFHDWLEGLRDKQTRRRIINRISRMQGGNYGDVAPVGEGVSELRLFFGAGYRVYFGEDNQHIVVILCGGDKSTQSDDIARAKMYWKEYKSYEKI